jgi:hypothetical protein
MVSGCDPRHLTLTLTLTLTINISPAYSHPLQDMVLIFARVAFRHRIFHILIRVRVRIRDRVRVGVRVWVWVRLGSGLGLDCFSIYPTLILP